MTANQFLYFAENVKVLTSKTGLASLGLDYIGSSASRESTTGPGGVSGCVFGPCADLRFVAEKQIWRRLSRTAGGTDETPVWVGFWNDRRPTPDDLARDTMLDGPMIKLRDGHSWQIPQLRQWRLGDGDGPPTQWTATVPRLLDLDADGNVINGDVVPEYRAIYDESIDIAQDLLGQLMLGETGTLEDDQVLSYAGRLVCTNYRANLSELLIVGALSPTECREIIQASIDFGGLKELLGKLQARISAAAHSDRG